MSAKNRGAKEANRGAKAASQKVVPPTGEDEPQENETAVAPPKKSLWQLVVSGVLVGLWLIFLAWMAFTG
jgi:hypothetical protein